MDAVARFKLSAALCIWALAVAGGALPFVGGQRISKRVNSVLNMLAAGIFLAGSCLHLLPDAQGDAALQQWTCVPTKDGGCFRWANFFYGSGFVLVMLVEVFAHELHRSLQPDDEDEHTHLLPTASLALDSAASSDPDVTVGSIGHSSCVESPDAAKNGRVYALNVDSEQRRLEDGLPLEDERSAYGSVEKTPVVHSPSRHQHQHFHGMVKTNPVLALVVLLALSFHSIMEGMGIGAADREAWDILLAVLAHKSLAAFALALEFLHHEASPRQMAASIGAFSLMTPLGILLGSLLVDSTQQTPASGICSALAGGTFLYVAIMEIIPQELQDPHYLVPKCSALVAGYCAMGVLSIWT
jgi:zinc transporter 1/2/3